MREKRSTNKYDVYEWVVKVINGCETTKQYLSARKLIYLFDNIYDDYHLGQSLRYIADNKRFKLTNNGQTTDSEPVK